MPVDMTARTTLFHNECRRLPVRTCRKLISEKCGHSIPHDACESIEARKSQSIGARNSIPIPPRIVCSVKLFAIVRWVCRFSGGRNGALTTASGAALEFDAFSSWVIFASS